MSASARVFYGELVNTWSLVRAAEAHKLIENQLLTMDLIMLRQSKGQLQTSAAYNSGVSALPAEVLLMIKDQLYPLGLREVTRTWQLNRLEYERESHQACGCCESGAYDKLFCRLEEQNKVKILTSWGWARWEASTVPEAYEGDNWDFELCLPSAKSLKQSQAEIEAFLFKVGLHSASKYVGQMGRTGQHEGYEATTSDLFSPISAEVAHSPAHGVNVELFFEEEANTGVVDLSFKSSSSREHKRHAFGLLFQKYRVEFVTPGEKPESDSSALKAGEVETKDGKKQKDRQPKLKGPEPRWMLWCDGDVNV